MTQFVNKKEDIVAEAVDGLIATSGGRLTRLDGYPHIRVVLRADWDKSKVAIVSGGGAGHEPAHAGFVGEGMLTAAVCGDVFASPSVDAVLAGILAVTGPSGCLLVVKNYTGDRLNFGLAAERARAFGLKVEMVIVDDDIALPDLPQARGVAGTLFVHKIAGAMAQAGADLATIAEAARGAISRVSTIGMSLDTCTIPGTPKDARIPTGKAELGLGIHGEAGAQQVEFSDARSATEMVAARLSKVLSKDKTYVALLNNLGGTSVLEMQVLAYELSRSSISSQITHVVGPATLMTSLEMRGFSVTLFEATAEELSLLDAPNDLANWPGLSPVSRVSTRELPDGLRPIRPMPSDHAATREFITLCCEILIDAEAKLNALDARAGDGDTGSTLAGAARALIGALDNLPLSDHTQLYRAIGQELSQSMGGSSGVLLAIMFAAAGDAASSGVNLVSALRIGLERMQQIGGAELGDRTMVDALHPALAVLEDGIEAAAMAARTGAAKTAEMAQARAGRSSYLNAEQLTGYVDPGAEAVACLFEGLTAKEKAV